MRVLVCGGRAYAKQAVMNSVLDQAHQDDKITLLICGAQRAWKPDLQMYVGADWLAIEWALKREVPFMGVPAPWKTFGTSSGPWRNGKMLELRPRKVIAFPGGRGTADMKRRAHAAHIPIQEVEEDS